MLSFATIFTFPASRFIAAVLLALPLLISTATAAPAADTHPLAKRQAVTKPKPKPKPTSAPVITAAQSVATPVATLAATGQSAVSKEPQTVQLKGIVLNADGRPCAGASVYPAGAPRQLVVTDAQGTFSLPVPAGAPLAVRVEYFGEGSSRVEVASPGTEVLRIKLGR